MVNQCWPSGQRIHLPLMFPQFTSCNLSRYSLVCCKKLFSRRTWFWFYAQWLWMQWALFVVHFYLSVHFCPAVSLLRWLEYAPELRAQRFKPRWSPGLFRLLYAIAKNCVHNCRGYILLKLSLAIYILVLRLKGDPLKL